MGLIGNRAIVNKSFAKYYGGIVAASFHNGNTPHNHMRPSILASRFSVYNPKASFPVGYNAGEAFQIAKSDGGIASTTRINGVGALSATARLARQSIATINGVGSVTSALSVVAPAFANISGSSSVSASIKSGIRLAASVSGSGSVTAAMSAIVPVSASLSGAGSIAANLKGRAPISATITIGASGFLSNDDVTRLADAVWDETTASHSTAGTTGKALTDAGGAGNPWSSTLAANNTSGTFGEKINKALTKAQFIGLK